MDSTVQAAFDTFQKKMALGNIGLADIFDVLSGFISEGQPHIAGAMSAHMRDFSAEVGSRSADEQQALTYATILSEGYRRTFCDPVTAAKYGTDQIAADQDNIIKLLDYLTGGLAMFAESDNPGQIALALSASTTGNPN